MRILIARDAWFIRWAPMIGSPTRTSSSTSSSVHFCICSLALRPELSAQFQSFRVSRLSSAPHAMLDQAQKARMAQNREQALYRLHKKRYFVSMPRGAFGVPFYHRGALLSSFPGASNFLYCQNNGHTPLSDQPDVNDTKHQYKFWSSPNSGVFRNHTNVEELQLVAGSTNVATQKIEQPQSGPLISTQEFDYVVVIDFEATCDKNMANLKPQEIIEFPSVLVDCHQLTLRDCFQTYVRPVHHPILTEFCTHLTGIQQEQVDKGMSLAEAIYLHDKWLEHNGIKGKNFAILIWSDWDCKIMLDSECKLKGLDKPQYFDRWINLKALFQRTFNGRKCNLRKAVEISGLKWMGRAHCGLDDAKNTARLALELMRQGTVLKVTGSLHSQALVAQIRRPKWHEAIQQEQLTCEPSSATDVQSSNGSAIESSVKENNTLLCFCGVNCKKHSIKKAGPTQGKIFFACGRWSPTEGCRCGFFEWATS